ncbi:MAG: 6-phosphogluconolactonase [Draconibacterium sp.]|nr:MAG: 6-phosphogluconolactonase [Draconibacterium sp.]
MKTGFIVVALLAILQVYCAGSDKIKLYVGTFTSEGAEGVYLCSFDTLNGDLSLKKTFKGIDDPSFLKLSPDSRFLYVVTRAPKAVEPLGGYVNAYSIDNEGNISFINKQVSHGAGPCYVDVSPDGKWVAIANYGGGSTAFFRVSENGAVEESYSVIRNFGSGPNKVRQNASHAHSIRFSPFDNILFGADLGTDQLNIFPFDNVLFGADSDTVDPLNISHFENKQMTSGNQLFVKLTPGSGPRHIEFFPDGKTIYVINELSSTVAVLKNVKESWKMVQEVSTLPSDFTGENYCADIHISKDGKYLYASNRGHNSIAVFYIKPDNNQLVFASTVSVEGNWPRNFTFSPDGRFMLVANQKSGNITVFSVDPKSGMPQFTGKETFLPAPVCLEFLTED